MKRKLEAQTTYNIKGDKILPNEMIIPGQETVINPLMVH